MSGSSTATKQMNVKTHIKYDKSIPILVFICSESMHSLLNELEMCLYVFCFFTLLVVSVSRYAGPLSGTFIIVLL